MMNRKSSLYFRVTIFVAELTGISPSDSARCPCRRGFPLDYREVFQ